MVVFLTMNKKGFLSLFSEETNLLMNVGCLLLGDSQDTDKITFTYVHICLVIQISIDKADKKLANLINLASI